MSTDEIKRALNAGFPREQIATREQGGKKLSYAEGHYVIRTLNRIFGNAAWSYRCTTREVFRERMLDKTKNGEVERWHVSYSASCELRAGDATIVDVGHGHGIDRDCGLAIESAEKEAATDALKRAAKSLGDACGLALYDKTQANVTDEAPAAAAHTVEEVLTLFATTRTPEEHLEAREAMGAIWASVADQAIRETMAKASRESFARTSKKESK